MQHWNFSPYFWGLHGKYNLRGSLQENDIQKFVAVLISLKKSFPKQCINNFAGLKYFSSGITDTKGNKQLPRKVWLFKSACCTVHLVKPFSSLIWVISISTNNFCLTSFSAFPKSNSAFWKATMGSNSTSLFDGSESSDWLLSLSLFSSKSKKSYWNSSELGIFGMEWNLLQR